MGFELEDDSDVLKKIFEGDNLPKYVKELKTLCDDFKIRYEINIEEKNFLYSKLDVKGDKAVTGLSAIITDVECMHPSWNVENSF